MALSCLGAINSDEFARQRRFSFDRRMDALGLVGKVGIERADDYAGVFMTHLFVKSNKVPAIQGEDGPLPGRSKRQHFRIGHRLANPARLLNRHRSVTKLAQRLHHRKREIFVGVKGCHAQAVSLLRI